MASEKKTLERLTVNLIPPASKSLKTGMDMTGLSKTDFINRAIQAYTYMEDVRNSGGTIFVREPGDDEMYVVVFI